MKIRFEGRAENAGVVRLAGDLDLLAAPGLRDQFTTIVTAGYRQLVVDMSKVGSIDSSGLSALIGGLKVARVAGGDFRIAVAAAPIRELLRQSSLDAILTPYRSVEEALAGYNLGRVVAA